LGQGRLRLAATMIGVGLLAAPSVAGCGTAAAPAAPKGRAPRPAAASAVAYANGRAYVSWQPGTGGPSDTYVVETMGSGAAPTRTVVAGTNTTVAGLIAGRSYSFGVAAANQAGIGNAATTNRLTAVGAVAPGAPVHPVLTASKTDNRVTVSWERPAPTPAPERYDVEVFEGGPRAQYPVGAFVCYAPCTTKTVAADPGTEASIRVSAANPAGRSPAVSSNRVPVAHPCALACVGIDATDPGTAETHPGSGFLHAIGPRTSPTARQALAAEHWRVSATFGSPAATYGEETTAGTVPGADLTELLSDDWRTSQHEPPAAANAGFAIPPWTDLAGYQAWMTTAVRAIEAVGRARGFTITYWEVQNEPFSPNFYSAGARPALPPALGGVGETVADFDAQYLAAYRGIKAADPHAKVVAPSLETWAAGPAEAGAEEAGSVDMRSFLDVAVINQAPPDAIAWHENDTYPLPDNFATGQGPAQPGDVQAAALQLRALLAERPTLGHPAILVNEYDSPLLSLVPGWDVGQLAALDTAGVSEANRACYYGTCGDGYLDGLLAGDGSTPLPGYWVYALYARTAGRQVPVATTFTGVTGLAAVARSGVVTALLGRHQGCPPAALGACVPAAVPISVKVGFTGSAQVTESGIPAGTGPLAGPVMNPTVRVPVLHGAVSITTPPMPDGDAVALVVAPG
ncbi:MAG: fibronectin type III domain-containing protein, partial [Actinomycetota bacterium]|nr:fibronectin type III domain-containing protein [Actinomycetota bacterium]